jgi:hypothetical protein
MGIVLSDERILAALKRGDESAFCQPGRSAKAASGCSPGRRSRSSARRSPSCPNASIW